MLAIGGELFAEGGFQRCLNANQGVLAQLLGEGVGELGVKTGEPDAVYLLLEFGNCWHRVTESEGGQSSPSAYQGMAKTG